MQAFFEYCTYARKKNPTPKRPRSPIIEFAFQCGNFACIHETSNPKAWKKAKYNGLFTYFCSEDCHNEWLSMPGTIGSWSPQKSFQTAETPSEFTL